MFEKILDLRNKRQNDHIQLIHHNKVVDINYNHRRYRK
jgi:hypothetical protein